VSFIYLFADTDRLRDLVITVVKPSGFMKAENSMTC
jgi:hypothetical protein